MANHNVSLQAATKSSTQTWQHDLELLFHHARERFPDVVWDLADEEVWGHKAIVYARAPPSFQNRYFAFRPYSGASALSLSLDHSRSPSPFRATSPGSYQQAQATPLRLTTSINPTLFSNELEYLYTGKGFGEAFEFLFDSPEAREDGADAEDLRIDKLRKDLVFMWRSRLYSDVRIALTGNLGGNHADSTAIFSSHRFILVSRSPYFHNALLAWPSPPKLPNEPLTLTLPSPPFTPASLHFTLGFIYTGTLVFSHRTYDLDTAFHIMRSAAYLSMDSLYDEIQARIVQEMMHGLFHAFLEFPEYESLTAGKWGSSGCRCRQCARRAPRILEFAVADDVKNPILDRGSRRALVGLFGEGWCTSEFAALNPKLRDGILKGLAKRTTPQNVFQLLYSSEHAMTKLTPVIDSWADTVREAILAARKTIDECLATQAEECFSQQDWLEIMESDGVGFQDTDRVKLIMAAALRGMNDHNAATLYQTLVSSILLRPHPTDSDAPMLPSTSAVRSHVEQTRVDVLHLIRKRWMSVRQEGGFDSLQPWALKEISDDIEVSTSDLVMPAPSAQKSMVMRSSLRPSSQLDVNSDVGSVHSLRVSVLNKNVTPSKRGTASSSQRDSGLASSSSSVRTTMTGSRMTIRVSTKNGEQRPDSKLTPPSIVEPETPAAPLSPEPEDPVAETGAESNTTTPTSDEPPSESPARKTLVRRPNSRTLSTASLNSRRSLASTSSSHLSPEPKTRASASSLRSRASRLASGPGAASTSSLRTTSSLSTSASVTSDDTSSVYRTAPASTASRSRRTSTASTVSTISVRSNVTANASLTPSARARRTSTASTASTATGVGLGPSRSRRTSTASTTSVSGVSTRTPAKKSPLPPVPSPDPSLRSSGKRTPSVRSVSTVSTAASAARKTTVTVTARKPAVKKAGQTVQPIRTDLSKGKQPERSPASSLAPSLMRKSSTDTITPTATIPPPLPPPVETEPVQELPLEKSPIAPPALLMPAASSPAPRSPIVSTPRGATLDIGIPCIISSKRKRFKAFARYIGEVEGETGPWVGVEVPIASDLSWSSWSNGDADGKENVRPEMDSRLWHDPEGRQWHDGSWGGVRYFEIGSLVGSDYWDSAEDRERAARRRRLDGMAGSGMGVGLGGGLSGGGGAGGGGMGKDSKGLLKREGEQLSVDRAKRMRSVSPATSDMSSTESRGLFVRPQQVLYVVDAVGGDW